MVEVSVVHMESGAKRHSMRPISLSFKLTCNLVMGTKENNLKHTCCVPCQVKYEWEIYLFAGTNPADKITLRARNASLELRRSVKSSFRPASKTNGNIDVGLDGFFSLSPFSIDRASVRSHVTAICI